MNLFLLWMNESKLHSFLTPLPREATTAPPYLTAAEDSRDHALWFGGLRGFVDENRTKLEPRQTRVTSADACATDHIRILRKQGQDIICTIGME